MKYAKISQGTYEFVEAAEECGQVSNEFFWLGINDDVSPQTHDFLKETYEFAPKGA